MGKAQERILQMQHELYFTDEHHTLNEKDLQKRIDKSIRCGLVDRRTVYNDIQILQQYGEEDLEYSEQNHGYYQEHDITPVDFLLMLERVAQSRLLDENDKNRVNGLIEKRLYPDAQELVKRGIAVRHKRMLARGNVNSTLSVLIAAMEKQRRIRFQYEIFDPYFRLVPKHNGQWYNVSCYCFQVDGNAIYVYAGDAEAKKGKTFRVERMVKVAMDESKIEPAEKYYGKQSDCEIRKQVNESVYHFNGESIKLSLAVRYEPFIMEVLWDLSRGTARTVADIAPNTIRVEFCARKSQPLFRVLASYADYIKVESPEEVVEDIRSLIATAKQAYEV